MYYRDRKEGGEDEFTGASYGEGNRPRRGLPSVLFRIIIDAADMFIEKGVCPTRAIVNDGQGEGVLLAPECLPDDKTKDSFARAISHTAADRNAVAVVFLAEGWMPGEKWDGVTAPEQCVDRREALLATAETVNGSATFSWQIHRDDDGVRLGDCEVTDAECHEGRFAGLLRRPGDG